MKGYSLHIGVNIVDGNHYPGMPELQAAVNDAGCWEKYAKGRGYQTKHLYNEEATTDAVIEKLHTYSSIMEPGDILLLTYSGHGGQIPNKKDDDVDKEKYDQTWCLYNEQLLDDELYESFKNFKEGTRILIVSDSCHSGTISRDINLSGMLSAGLDAIYDGSGKRSRKLPQDVLDAVMASASDAYQKKQKKYKNSGKRKDVKAAVKLLAACQDDQVTYDGEKYGIFTKALSDILSSNKKTKTAEQLVSAVKKVYGYPKPNFFQYGAIIPSFDAGDPFKIDIEHADKIKGYRKPDLAAFQEPDTEEDILTGDIDRNAVLSIETRNSKIKNVEPGSSVKIIKKAEAGDVQKLLVEVPGIPYRSGWSAAHALQTQLKEQGIDADVEPVLHFNPDKEHATARASSGSNDYIPEWPPANADPVVKIGWHLDDEHSQLASAAKRVMANADAHVKVGHVDTGYLPGHIALPQNLQRGCSFVEGETDNPGEDKPDSGMDGHGMGTMGILAGNNVPLSATFNEFEGYVGGVPFAEVIPIRIAESVIIWNSDNFCSAIDYALERGCEVVTMSMAGKPSRKMAKAINKAYEEGLVIVSAASNCWYKGVLQVAPKCVIWPAAFERVIAATGAMYDHKPYDKDFLLKAKINFTEYMQGCWGPESRMKKALAAYTPNTPWAAKGNIISRSGGGTSSATPQIAAAAALWIAHNRKDMEAAGFYTPGNKWKIVEAVRYALYHSAAKDEVFADWKKYYGNGVLRANKALDIKVADVGTLNKSAEAESSFGGFFQILGSFFKNRRLFRDAVSAIPPEDSLALELLQLMQTDPDLFEVYSSLNLESNDEIEKLIADETFINKVLSSIYASEYLKQAMVK